MDVPVRGANTHINGGNAMNIQEQARRIENQLKERGRQNEILREKERTAYYCRANNLLIRIERGDVAVNIHTINRLWGYVCKAYDHNDIMLEWWAEQIQPYLDLV